MRTRMADVVDVQPADDFSSPRRRRSAALGASAPVRTFTARAQNSTVRVATWYSATTSAVVSTARTWTSAQRMPSSATDDAQVAAPKRISVPVWRTGFTLAWPRMSDRSHSQAMMEAITLATCSMISEPVRPAPRPTPPR